MERNIILASHLFGTIYLFSKSIELYNKTYFEYKNQKIPDGLILSNIFMITFTGLLFIDNLCFSSYIMQRSFQNILK